MNINEAYQVIEVSEEERKSIHKYVGFSHTSINVLGDLTPQNVERLQKEGWLLKENPEQLKEGITDFVNLYAMMYKNSKRNNRSIHVIRGTSNQEVNQWNNIISHIVSTSRNENVAKTFTKYGSGALIHFQIGKGVPFLDIEEYRNENLGDEEEIILAPFCEITKKELNYQTEDYCHYTIKIEAPKLKEVPKEQLDTMLEEVVSGFLKNIEDMKEYMELGDKIEFLSERLKWTTNKEDISYIAKDKEEAYNKFIEISERTNIYRKKLQTVLKGLCKQKEIEIDEATKVIEEYKEKKLAEERALQIETQRREIISALSAKLIANPTHTANLERSIAEKYQGLLKNEETFKKVAKALGIDYTKLVSRTKIGERVQNVQENLKNIEDKTNSVIVNENASLEEISELNKQIEPLLNGVIYGMEVMKDCPDVVKMHQEQLEKEIKMNLYQKVQATIQYAKIEKYKKEKETIQNTKIGFFGKLIGEDKLQEEKMRNLTLKIAHEQNTPSQIEKKCDVEEMLDDLYICVSTEFNGQFEKVPEIQEIYNSIKGVFGIEEKDFSDDYTRDLASKKTSNRNLPMLQEKKTSFFSRFGKTREQTRILQTENQELEKIITSDVSEKKWSCDIQVENNALSIFENILKRICMGTNELTREIEDLETTLGRFSFN